MITVPDTDSYLSAKQATCSCGQQSALHCTCDKATSENEVAGPRCSCRARPAGECTCDRASDENSTLSGATCQCGSRPSGKVLIRPSPPSPRLPNFCRLTLCCVSGACTCEKAADGTYNPANEVDFTTK